MDDEMRRALARQIAGLDGIRHDDADFKAAVHRLEGFLAENHRAPAAACGHDAYEAWLGSWLDAQRVAGRRGSLLPRRRAALDHALGPHWAKDR
jgi:hypothetical protein